MADRMCSPVAPQSTACNGNHQFGSWNWVDEGYSCVPSINRWDLSSRHRIHKINM
jgi:hypothetical protein